VAGPKRVDVRWDERLRLVPGFRSGVVEAAVVCPARRAVAEGGEEG
jgi:hypothetical protein